jgi:hypothetical protein
MKAEGAPPLMEALAAKKSAIIRAWLARAFQTYPGNTSRFLGQENDPFRNPVGHTLREAFPVLLDAVLGGADTVGVTSALDGIVRIRAVQNFTAGQAVAFVFLLKPVIRETLHFPPHPPLSPLGGEDKGEGANQLEDLAVLERRIDEMALLAFDLFMKCRERIYEIKANEARRRIEILLKRQRVEGRSGDTENGGNGEASRPIPDSPVLRFPDSPIQDWNNP